MDPSDSEPEWAELTTDLATAARPLAENLDALRSLAVAACREALEEAAILPVCRGTLGHEDALAMRGALAEKDTTLRELLRARGLQLDLGALLPLSRWITPRVEPRRFDARFFLLAAPPGQRGAHDDHETTSSFWARPSEVLARFDAETLQLAPPTHRTLALLAPFDDVAAALRGIVPLSLDPICPEVMTVASAGTDTIGLALPGDPEHSVRVTRIAGPTRFVLRGARFVPEEAP